MFNKQILVLIILVIGFGLPSLQAQMSTHSLGASAPFAVRTYDVGGGSKNTDAYYLAQFSYGFRKNLTETDNSSFSLGTVASAGAGLYSDVWGSGVLYSGGLQLWGDFNKGMGAVPDPAKNSGFHTGLGFGASYSGADGDPIDEYDGISIGPMGRIGYRFGVYSRKKDRYSPMGISFFYQHGLEKARWRTFGFHILADL